MASYLHKFCNLKDILRTYGGKMKFSRLSFVFLLMFAFLFTGQSFADINIFVWEHDNNLRQYDPVFRTNLTAEQSIMRTLDQENVDYDHHRNLPNDLNQYDVIIVPLSFYCPG